MSQPADTSRRDAVSKTLSELEAELKDCVEAYNAAASATSRARNSETDALNNLNRVQRAIDAQLATLRKSAPHSSDWKRDVANRHLVEAA